MLSNICHGTFFALTHTQCGSVREQLLSKIEISRVVCLHLKLIGSHLHSDLLAKWPCQLVSAAASHPWDFIAVEAWEASCPKTLKHSILTFFL